MDKAVNTIASIDITEPKYTKRQLNALRFVAEVNLDADKTIAHAKLCPTLLTIIRSKYSAPLIVQGAFQALCNLLSLESNYMDERYSQMLVDAFLHILRDREETQKISALKLLALICQNDKTSDKVRKSKGIRDIINILKARNGSTSLMEATVGTVNVMSKNDMNALAFSELDGIKLISSMLLVNSTTLQIKQICIHIIHNLSKLEQNKEKILESGIIQILVRCVLSDQRDISHTAINTLCQLIKDGQGGDGSQTSRMRRESFLVSFVYNEADAKDQALLQLEQAEAVSIFSALLEKHELFDLSFIESVMFLLSKMLVLPSSRSKIEQDTIFVLAILLQKYKSLSINENVTRALAYLTNDEKDLYLISKITLESLLTLLMEDNVATSDDVKKYCLMCFSNMARNADNKFSMEKNGTLAHIVKMMQSKCSSHLLESCIACLANLESHDDLLLSIGQEIGIGKICTWGNEYASKLSRMTFDFVNPGEREKLINMLTYMLTIMKSLFIKGKQYDLDLLSNCLRPRSLIIALDKKLLRLPNTTKTQECAVYLLRKLSEKGGEFANRFIGLNGVMHLIPLIKTANITKDTLLLENIFKLLANLSDRGDYCKLNISESGVVSSVLDVLQRLQTVYESKHSKIIQHGLEILKNLASEKRGSLWLGELGAIPVLVQYAKMVFAKTKDTDPDTELFSELSVGALWEIASFDVNREKIHKAAGAKLWNSLLKYDNVNIQESVSGLITALAINETVRDDLEREGTKDTLEHLSSTADDYLSKMAAKALKYFYKSLERSTMSSVGTIRTMRVDSLSEDDDSVFNTDPFIGQKSEIEFSFSCKFEEKVRQITENFSIHVVVSWNFFDANLPMKDKQQALEALQDEKMWKAFRTGLKLLCKNEKNRSLFSNSVQEISIQLDEFTLFEFDKNKKQLKYNINYVGKDFYDAKDVKERILTLVTTSYLSTANLNWNDDSAVLHIKKFARESHRGNSYVQKFAEVINKTSTQWIPNKFEAMAIELAQAKLCKPDEVFIKGWRVIKINHNGAEQERFLLLTNKNYYTVKFDFQKQVIQNSRSKPHPLSQFHIVDIAPLIDSNKGISNDNLPVVAMRIFSTKSSILGINQANDINSSSRRVLNSKSPGKSEKRPPTDGCNFSIYTAPKTVEESKQSAYIAEVAWAIYGYACAASGTRLHEPFTTHLIEKPTPGITSAIYNKIKRGLL